MGKLRTLVIGAVLGLAPLVSNAALISLGANLTPQQEVPAPNVSGFNPSGLFLGSVDTVTGQLNWFVTYTGLTSNVNNAHFHAPAAVGVTGPPEIDIRNQAAGSNAENAVTLFQGAGITATSGAFAGTASLSATEINELLGGLWYLNIHTVNNTPGEIRGQVFVATAVTPVPLPAAAWAFGAGLLGVASAKRRRES